MVIIIGAGMAVLVLRDRAESAYHREIKALDVALSEQTLRYVQVMDMLLQKVVARSTELQVSTQDEFRREYSTEGTHDFLRRLLENSPQANAFSVSDAAGKMVALSRWYPTPDVDSSTRDYIRHFLEQKDSGLFVSAPFTAKAVGLPVVVMARQVTASNGSLLGVVALSLSVDYLDDLYQSSNAQPGQSVTLLRQDGMVLVRSPDPTHQAGSFMPEASPWYKLVKTGGGSYRSIGFLGGIPALVSVHPLQGFPLVLNVSVKEAEALAAWRHDANWIGITVLAAVTGFIILFSVIARQIRRREEQHSALQRTTVKLAQTATRLNDFALTGSDWFWEQDADLRFVPIGPETPLLNSSDRSHLGKRRWEINDTTREPALWAKHEQDVISHQPFRDFRYDRIGVGGTRNYISISGVPVHDEVGTFMGYRGTGHDITAQVTAEAELIVAKDRAERAEAMMQDALDSMSEGIVIYDADDRLVLCNEAYHQQFPDSSASMVAGASFSEVLRGRIASGQFPEAIGREDAWFDERVAQHHQASATFERHLPGGGWMLVTERRMRNGGVAGLRVDITAFKQAQAALQDSEMRLERAQETAGIGSWELDLATGRYIWSKQLYRMRGLSPETFHPTRKSIASSIHADDLPIVSAWLARLQAGNECDPIEVRVRRADSKARVLLVEGRSVVDSDGVIRRLAGTMQDITDRRLIERQLAHAQKMEAIGNLTGGMAHDFNNVLGVIIGNLDLQKRLIKDNQTAIELCDEALDGAVRCADLIRRLLAFARRQSLHPEHTDVNALIINVSKLLNRTLGENVTLRSHLEPDLWSVIVDAVQLEAALVNFATNARDAMPAGGQLDITTSNTYLDDHYAALHPEVKVGDHVMITISDTGAGIPQEIIGRIFEPFFTTKEPGAGTGLGLAMIFGFITQSGGHVAVYSESGRGTTFRVYLQRDRTVRAEVHPDAALSAIVGGRETVLVVEDNDQLRWVAIRQLATLGYRVREAENAEAALEVLATEGPVDLLFTDLVMPGDKDGLALASEVTRDGRTKVLLTSGFARVRGADQRLAASPFRMLNKPYRNDELARAVRAALDDPGDIPLILSERPADRSPSGPAHTVRDTEPA